LFYKIILAQKSIRQNPITCSYAPFTFEGEIKWGKSKLSLWLINSEVYIPPLFGLITEIEPAQLCGTFWEVTATGASSFGCFSTWNREKETHLEMIASMKVKAGVRSTIAEDKVGELYPMPVDIKVWTQQL
jgi:hypothetical protein